MYSLNSIVVREYREAIPVLTAMNTREVDSQLYSTKFNLPPSATRRPPSLHTYILYVRYKNYLFISTMLLMDISNGNERYMKKFAFYCNHVNVKTASMQDTMQCLGTTRHGVCIIQVGRFQTDLLYTGTGSETVYCGSMNKTINLNTFNILLTK